MMADNAGIGGWLRIEVRGPDGRLVAHVGAKNLITDAGDAYQAARVAAGVGPAAAADAPAMVTGIKLGGDATPAAKNGAGAALGAYLAGAAAVLDAGSPQVTGTAGGGTQIVYRAVFPAGLAATIREGVLVTDAGTDATSPAGATIARAVLPAPVDKAADATLTATWTHTYNGA